MAAKKKPYTEPGLEKAGFTEPAAALFAINAIMEGAPEFEAERILELALFAPSPDEALVGLSAVIKANDGACLSGLTKLPDDLEGLIFILGASPFLSNLLSTRPKLLKWLFLEKGLYLRKDRERFTREIKEALQRGNGGENVKKTLRLYRQGEFVRLGARDLLGLATMEETTKELSVLASAMLDEAIAAAISELTERFGAPCHGGSGFAVIGLGKLGAGELNYSSDIDIMYICERVDNMTEGVTGQKGSAISTGEFYTKLAVKVTALISEVTAEGLVFRVDLALRPGGGSGAIIQSLAGAEHYYEAQGREWERAAMIKANCVAGDRETGRAFLRMIRPFVFRRNLDFTAIEEIKTMKENINLANPHHDGGGFNVKLGQGGIREIEFFAQTMQLVHGGRESGLRQRGTLAALKALTEKGLVKAEDEKILKKAYIYLRNLEHRLQIIECRQTHTLVEEKKELKRVARMMGHREKEPFLKELKKITDSVHNVFRGLFYGSSVGSDVDKRVLSLFSPETGEDECKELLREMGFVNAAKAFKNLELLRKGPPGLRRTSARGRAIFEKAAPYLLTKILAAPDPDMALRHLERFISSAGARSTQYALLMENPPVADELINVFGTSDFLSNNLTSHPENIDFMLSRELSTPVKTKKQFLTTFNLQVLARDMGLEEALDAMRRIRNAEVMRIGLNHLAAAITPREVSTQMTGLAEAALHAAWQVAAGELGKKHRAPESSRFAVLGLGKLGARELGFGSDLDIVFIYEPAPPGIKQRAPLDNTISDLEYFVRLGQRIINALSVKTREGSCFEVDTRLRPSGNSGPLVVSLESLLKYHRSATAVWERQAFIRARHVAGDSALGEEAVRGLKELLFGRELKEADVREMVAIRKRMENEIGKETGQRYNFKTGRGGLVDIEFLVQALQLRWGGGDPSLRHPGTIAALEALKKSGLIDKEDYAFLRKAYAFLRALEMGERIMFDRAGTFLVKDELKSSPIARALGYEAGTRPGARLLADYEEISSGVREIYTKTLNNLFP